MRQTRSKQTYKMLAVKEPGIGSEEMGEGFIEFICPAILCNQVEAGSAKGQIDVVFSVNNKFKIKYACTHNRWTYQGVMTWVPYDPYSVL